MKTMRITHARWLTPEGYFEEGTIEIAKGRIARLSTNRHPAGKAKEVLDARGYLILPGMIDPHVHFREPGQVYKEGIRNGSKAALKGGVTTVIDMPNNRPPVTTPSRLKEKRERFRRKSLVNWGVMFHASGKMYDIDALAKSVKIFMARSSSLTSITDEKTLLRLFEFYDRVSVHAEDESVFPKNGGHLPHHERRPRKAVLNALHKIERVLRALPAEKRPRVILCHANTAEETEWLRKMKRDGFDIRAETAPHYLFFTRDDVQAKGAFLQVNPPIRTLRDQQALRRALAENVIDFIGTDHAPHVLFEKQGEAPPSGIAAIEWALPLMLNLIDDGTVNWEQFHRLICGGAAEAYDIAGRDGIKEGNWADFVFVKRTTAPTMNAHVISKAGVNVYKEVGCCWQVEQTMVNGIVKYRKGKFIDETPGHAV
jgi:dihydroorotase